MALRSPRWGLLAACLLSGAMASSARANPPTAAQMLNYRPRMEDVVCTNPTAEEQNLCKVEPVVSGKKTIGWSLVDARKQIVRRFLDTDNDGRIDVWGYYRDGFEIYREIDTNHNDIADQYRWFNDGGMKWGTDANEDKKIDTWRMISAEEVGLEVFRALSSKDFDRLRPLFISATEMRDLKLSQAQIDRIKAQVAKAPAKFRETCEKLNLDPRSQFVRVESVAPSCIPGDTLGMDTDLIRFPSRAILYEVAGEKRHDWVHSGELVQVGLSWRLTEAPGETEIGVTPQLNKELARLYAELDNIDKQGPAEISCTTPAAVQRMVNRAGVVEQILAKVEPDQRETWIKQLLDNLGAAAYAAYSFPSDKNATSAMTRLVQLKNQLEENLRGSNLAGYANYREMCAYYLPRLSDPRGGKTAELGKLQEEWHGKLSKFVEKYPNVDDTPDALQQLGIGSEFAGKDEEAKRWYTQIFTSFADHHLAAKAKGCVRRLSSVNQPMELSAPTLDGAPFDISQLKGKAVAVYYWASYCQSCPREFAMLKQIQANLGAKGVEIVCVNLDDSPQDATRFLQSNPLRAIHVYQQAKNGGGLNSPLATHYGINGLPTVFVLDREGKVISRTLQVNDLEDALKKAL